MADTIKGNLKVGNEVAFDNYPNTRDDSGTFAPTSFLYTDPTGNVFEAPFSLLPGAIVSISEASLISIIGSLDPNVIYYVTDAGSTTGQITGNNAQIFVKAFDNNTLNPACTGRFQNGVMASPIVFSGQYQFSANPYFTEVITPQNNVWRSDIIQLAALASIDVLKFDYPSFLNNSFDTVSIQNSTGTETFENNSLKNGLIDFSSNANCTIKNSSTISGNTITFNNPSITIDSCIIGNNNIINLNHSMLNTVVENATTISGNGTIDGCGIYSSSIVEDNGNLTFIIVEENSMVKDNSDITDTKFGLHCEVEENGNIFRSEFGKEGMVKRNVNIESTLFGTANQVEDNQNITFSEFGESNLVQNNLDISDTIFGRSNNVEDNSNIDSCVFENSSVVNNVDILLSTFEGTTVQGNDNIITSNFYQESLTELNEDIINSNVYQGAYVALNDFIINCDFFQGSDTQMFVSLTDFTVGSNATIDGMMLYSLVSGSVAKNKTVTFVSDHTDEEYGLNYSTFRLPVTIAIQTGIGGSAAPLIELGGLEYAGIYDVQDSRNYVEIDYIQTSGSVNLTSISGTFSPGQTVTWASGTALVDSFSGSAISIKFINGNAPLLGDTITGPTGSGVTSNNFSYNSFIVGSLGVRVVDTGTAGDGYMLKDNGTTALVRVDSGTYIAGNQFGDTVSVSGLIIAVRTTGAPISIILNCPIDHTYKLIPSSINLPLLSGLRTISGGNFLILENEANIVLNGTTQTIPDSIELKYDSVNGISSQVAGGQKL